MPISMHYKGKGREVMDSMMKTYGKKKKAEEVFYAMENSMKKRKKKKHG